MGETAILQKSRLPTPLELLCLVQSVTGDMLTGPGPEQRRSGITLPPRSSARQCQQRKSAPLANVVNGALIQKILRLIPVILSEAFWAWSIQKNNARPYEPDGTSSALYPRGPCTARAPDCHTGRARRCPNASLRNLPPGWYRRTQPPKYRTLQARPRDYPRRVP